MVDEDTLQWGGVAAPLPPHPLPSHPLLPPPPLLPHPWLKKASTVSPAGLTEWQLTMAEAVQKGMRE